MKKLIVLLLLVATGCSKIESSKSEESSVQEAKKEKVDFKFKGKKLLITNHSQEILTVSESETKFSIEKNGKWHPVEQTSGLLSLTYNVLSEEVYEYDLTKRLSEINSKKIKVTVFYNVGTGEEQKQYQRDIFYKE